MLMPVPAMVYIPSRELVTPILIVPGCLFSRPGRRGFDGGEIACERSSIRSATTDTMGSYVFDPH